MKQFLTLSALTGLAAAAAIQAAPLDKKDLPSDPALLAHVDFDALKSTSVGKTILSDQDVQTKLAAVQAMFNFDLRTQLHGFTIFTTVDRSQSPALIVYADFDADRLITMARAFPGFSSQTNGGRVTYEWTNEKNEDDTPRIHAAISGHRVVFAKEESALTGALDVIDGKSSSYKGEKLLLPSGSGDLVVAEGCLRKVDVPENNPASAIFQSSKAVRFQVAESGEKIGAKVSFEAKDDDAATQVAAMINGLLALVKIQKDNANPDLTKLANAVSVKQDGVTVTLGLSESSADLVQMIKHGAEKHKEKIEEKVEKEEAREKAAESKP